MAALVPVSAVVEGAVDEAVVRRLGNERAVEFIVHGRRGKAAIIERMASHEQAARVVPAMGWLVLVDLDREAECAPSHVRTVLNRPPASFTLRIAVRAIEAWFLADREAFAAFFRVSKSKLPSHPESLVDPKSAVVDLARQSRSRDVRQDMVPSKGSGRRVGPAYPSRLIESVTAHWDPDRAEGEADSLRRARRRLSARVRDLRRSPR